MSSQMIARWNSISMNRDTEQQNGVETHGGGTSGTGSLKRRRSNSIGEEGYYKDLDDDIEPGKQQGTWHVEEEEDDDDNMSLVSRSPSPPLPNADGDINMDEVYRYDEHVRGFARDEITVETKIQSTNKGFSLLAKMGWVEGQPVGLSGDGRVDPIPFSVKNDMTGLGKISQDYEMIESTVAQRRNLDSERMRFETHEQKVAREASVAQKATLESEISTVLKPFYCELCDKQFKNVAQYDEHTNSYAHHHKARMKDLHGSHPMRMSSALDADARKEKERKREEKELRKMARAMGVKMPITSGSNTLSAKTDTPERKSGWASVPAAPSLVSNSAPAVSSAPSTPPIISPSPSGSNINRGPATANRMSAWQSLPPTPPPAPAYTITPLPTPTPPTSAWRTLPSEFTSPIQGNIPLPRSSSAERWTGSAAVATELFPSGVPPPMPPSQGASPSMPSTPRRSGWAPVPQQQLSQSPSTETGGIGSSSVRSGWSMVSSSNSESDIPAPVSVPPPAPITGPVVPSSSASPSSLTPASSEPLTATAVSTKQVKKAAAAAAEEVANKSRGNWQNFKKGFGKR